MKTFKYMQNDVKLFELPDNPAATDHDAPADVINHIIGDGQLLSDFDLEVLECLKTYYNRPKKLAQICVPAFLSLVATAMLLVSLSKCWK